MFICFVSWRVGSSSALDPEGVFYGVVKGSQECFVQWDGGSIQCRESASDFLCRVLGWGSGQLDEKWVVVDFYAHVAQLAEHVLGKDEVSGSIPLVGSIRLSQRAARNILLFVKVTGCVEPNQENNKGS